MIGNEWSMLCLNHIMQAQLLGFGVVSLVLTPGDGHVDFVL